jgi:hypothetical protein
MVAVEILGDNSYLQTLPATVHLGRRTDGGVVVWLDDACDSGPALDETRPGREPEVELHGPGALPRAILEHPRAQYVETFIDGLGDPEAAPLGWWHARVWLRSAG